MALNRRHFLLHSAASGLGLACLTASGLQVALGATEALTLLCVFLRGGCDGLSIVMPLAGDDRQIYAAERPNLQIPVQGALPLDSRFGLHPAAKALHTLYLHKRLAFVHAVGTMEPTRSHFDAQAMIELGTPGRRAGGTGWLARYLTATHQGSASNHQAAVALGTLLPTSLLGFDEAGDEPSGRLRLGDRQRPAAAAADGAALTLRWRQLARPLWHRRVGRHGPAGRFDQ